MFYLQYTHTIVYIIVYCNDEKMIVLPDVKVWSVGPFLKDQRGDCSGKYILGHDHAYTFYLRNTPSNSEYEPDVRPRSDTPFIITELEWVSNRWRRSPPKAKIEAWVRHFAAIREDIK